MTTIVCPGAPKKPEQLKCCDTRENMRQPDFSQCTTDIPPPDSPLYSDLLSPCAVYALSKINPKWRDYQSPPGSPGPLECPYAPRASRFKRSFSDALKALEEEATAAFEALKKEEEEEEEEKALAALEKAWAAVEETLEEKREKDHDSLGCF